MPDLIPPLPPDLWTRLCEVLAEARRGRYDGGRIILEVDGRGFVTWIIPELGIKHRREPADSVLG
jgi:hypothetical protein